MSGRRLGRPVISEQAAAARMREIARQKARSLLTERQYEVLVLAADGLTSRQIAAVLGIGRDTVMSHRKRLFALLGADTIAHAVHLAHLRGILIGSEGHQ